MKTPEELAQDYADRNCGGECPDDEPGVIAAFKAGYQAAKDQLFEESGFRLKLFKDEADAKAAYQEAMDQIPEQTAFEEGYKLGVKESQPQWISVKDRLPEEGQDCVIYVDWVDVWDKGSERITYQEIAVFNGEDRFYHRSHTELNRVTHWMPLPAAPEEEA